MDTNSTSSPTPVGAQTPPVFSPAATAQPTPQATPVQSPQVSSTPPANVVRKGMPLALIILFIFFAFLGGLLLAGWYFQMQFQKIQVHKKPEAQSSQAVPDALPKTLVIGTDATFPPMEYYNKQGGLVGFDVDLGDKIGAALGVKVDFKNIKWDDLFNALDSKKVDVIISSVSITDERKQKYDFSDSYLNAGQVVITQRTNNTISSAADLKGKKIGVQKGTTDEQEAEKLTSDDLVIRYDDYEKATKALVAGDVDAILSDLTSAKGIVTENPTLKISTDPLTNENYGIVLRKGDTELQAKLNSVIRSLKANGILTDFKQKWLD